MCSSDLALTVAYIIYYAVMVARDLYDKNGEKIKSGEEELEVSNFDEEESVSVVENDKGFNIGDNEYETHYIGETRNVSGETNHADEKTKQDVIEALNNKVKANTEETRVTFSNPYNSAELYKLMMQNGIGELHQDGGVTSKNVIDEL